MDIPQATLSSLIFLQSIHSQIRLITDPKLLSFKRELCTLIEDASRSLKEALQGQTTTLKYSCDTLVNSLSLFLSSAEMSKDNELLRKDLPILKVKVEKDVDQLRIKMLDGQKMLQMIKQDHDAKARVCTYIETTVMELENSRIEEIKYQESLKQARKAEQIYFGVQKQQISKEVKVGAEIESHQRDIDLCKQQIKELTKLKKIPIEREELKQTSSASIEELAIQEQLSQLEIERMTLEEELAAEKKRLKEISNKGTSAQNTKFGQNKFHLIFLANLSSETNPPGLLKSLIGSRNYRNALEDKINATLSFQMKHSYSGDIYSVVSFDATSAVVQDRISITRPFSFSIENKKGAKDILQGIKQVYKQIEKTQSYIPIIITLFHSKSGKVKFSNLSQSIAFLTENTKHYEVTMLGHNFDVLPNFEELICSGNKNAKGGLAELGNQKFFCYTVGEQVGDFFESALQKINSHYKAKMHSQVPKLFEESFIQNKRLEQIREDLQTIGVKKRSLEIDLTNIQRSLKTQSVRDPKKLSSENEHYQKQIDEYEDKIDKTRGIIDKLKERLNEDQTQNKSMSPQPRREYSGDSGQSVPSSNFNEDVVNGFLQLRKLYKEYTQLTHPVTHLISIHSQFQECLRPISTLCSEIILEVNGSTSLHQSRTCLSAQHELTIKTKQLVELSKSCEQIRKISYDVSFQIY